MRKYFVLLLALLFMLSGCVTPSSAKQDPPIEVTDAWVRTVGGMRSRSGSDTALYMTIKNNSDSADKLLNVGSDVAQMVQIHQSEMDANGVSSMHGVEAIDIPAGGTAELQPGGYHVMLMGLTRDLKEGDSVTFTLTLQRAGKVVIQATVKTP
jgi:copper(I)-binding protein